MTDEIVDIPGTSGDRSDLLRKATDASTEATTKGDEKPNEEK